MTFLDTNAMGDRICADKSVRVDFARLWNPSAFGIELFEAQLWTHRFGKHFHDAYTIGLNESGEGRCFYRRELHHHYPGSFNCINPGEGHTGEVVSDSGWGFRNLYVSTAVVGQVVAQLHMPIARLPRFSKMVVENSDLQQPLFVVTMASQNVPGWK